MKCVLQPSTCASSTWHQNNTVREPFVNGPQKICQTRQMHQFSYQIKISHSNISWKRNTVKKWIKSKNVWTSRRHENLTMRSLPAVSLPHVWFPVTCSCLTAYASLQSLFFSFILKNQSRSSFCMEARRCQENKQNTWNDKIKNKSNLQGVKLFSFTISYFCLKPKFWPANVSQFWLYQSEFWISCINDSVFDHFNLNDPTFVLSQIMTEYLVLLRHKVIITK